MQKPDIIRQNGRSGGDVILLGIVSRINRRKYRHTMPGNGRRETGMTSPINRQNRNGTAGNSQSWE